MKPASLAPVYAAIWSQMSEAARSCGYALAVHGSMQRDLDVVAIPWTAEATSAEEVVRAMAETCAIRAGTDLVIGYSLSSAPPLPHGRECFSIPFRMDGDAMDPGYVDVSVMPRSEAVAACGRDAGRAGTVLAKAPCEPIASASSPPASTGERGGDPADEQMDAGPFCASCGASVYCGGCGSVYVAAASGERSPRAGTALGFDDALRIAKGCTDYGGGYRGDDKAFEVYQHGIQTVINALTAAAERGLADTQIRALHRMGSEPPPPRFSGTTASEEPPRG